jgi:hypothetical protein
MWLPPEQWWASITHRSDAIICFPGKNESIKAAMKSSMKGLI